MQESGINLMAKLPLPLHYYLVMSAFLILAAFALVSCQSRPSDRLQSSPMKKESLSLTWSPENSILWVDVKPPNRVEGLGMFRHFKTSNKSPNKIVKAEGAIPDLEAPKQHKAISSPSIHAPHNAHKVVSGNESSFPKEEIQKLIGSEEPEVISDVLKQARVVMIGKAKGKNYAQLKTILTEVQAEGSNPIIVHLARNKDMKKFKVTESHFPNRAFFLHVFSPTHETHIGAQKFLFSQPVYFKNRDYMALYAHKEEKVIWPSILFRSASGGEWRVAPFIFKGHLSKGVDDSERGYTQLTQLHPDISTVANAILISMEKVQRFEDFDMQTFGFSKKDSLNKIFSIKKEKEDMQALKDFRSNTVFHKWPDDTSRILTVVTECKPGWCFRLKDNEKAWNGKETTEFFEKINNHLTKLEGFLPKFEVEKIMATYTFDHASLGKTTVEIFQSTFAGTTMEWHMASDSKGRSWVARVRNVDSQPTKYGSESSVIDVGIIRNKPLDYKHYVSALAKSSFYEEYSDSYADISGFLAHLEPIKSYKEFRRVR